MCQSLIVFTWDNLGEPRAIGWPLRKFSCLVSSLIRRYRLETLDRLGELAISDLNLFAVATAVFLREQKLVGPALCVHASPREPRRACEI